MKNLYEFNKNWMLSILSGVSDRELKAVYEYIQSFFQIMNSDISLFMEFFDCMNEFVVDEITRRYFQTKNVES